MSSTTQTPAALRLFRTHELVEAILLKVPDNTTLLRSQRVSKTFNSCVKTSPTIQQRLFFRIATNPNTLTHFISADKMGGDGTKYNPLAFTRPRINLRYQLSLRRTPGIPNGYRMHLRLPNFKHSLLVHDNIHTLKFCADELSPLPQVSYLDMYLQQPLPASINIVLFPRAGSLAIWQHAQVKVKPGTLREILGIAMGLKNAVEEKGAMLEGEFRQGKWIGRREDEEVEAEEPEDEVVWESHFSYELRGMLLGQPEFLGWDLTRLAMMMGRRLMNA